MTTNRGLNLKKGILTLFMLLYLILYNRWGNIVYEKSDYKNDWDGNSNVNKVGTVALPMGTYFYLFEYGNKNHKTGYVYIDR